MFVRNAWYVAAWDHEITQEGLFTRTILNEPILLYRTQDGQPVALDNRCCHRLAPLSLGRREGDCVRCGYHGLKFNAEGKCVEIPGQPSIPPQAQIKRYPVVEKNRWVFVWMGDPSKADEALLPDNFSNSHPGWRMKPGYLHYDTSYLLIVDNLLDFSHLSYVHEKTLGGSTDIAQSKATIERLDRGIKVSRRIPSTVPAPYHRKFGHFEGNVERWFIYDFLVPATLLMDSGVKPMGQAHDDFSGALRLHSCQALTPETEHATHYFFQQAHSFALDDSIVTDTIYQSLVAAFEEDRTMIHAQQDMLRLNPAAKMLPIAADAALNHFRRIVQRLCAEEHTG